MKLSTSSLVRLEGEQVVYDGAHGELLRLHWVTLLLTLCTLGTYRFWARTRMRRYVWSHTSLLGDRFEYTGTGKELFVGFLKAGLALAFVAGLSYGTVHLATTIGTTEREQNVYSLLFSLPVYLTLSDLAKFGGYSARRGGSGLATCF